MPASAADLQLLAQYDTPTISNVIELFEIRPRNTGFMDGRIRACFPEMPPIVGYASTATMRTAYARLEGSVYGSLDQQVSRFAELPGPAIVVFQDLDDPPVGATFGEIMCSSYQCFGALGIVTSGPARDLDQVRRLGFAAFSNGVVCSHSYSHITSIDAPVRVGGLEVHSGDLLHADANGVCSVPESIAREVAQAAVAEDMRIQAELPALNAPIPAGDAQHSRRRTQNVETPGIGKDLLSLETRVENEIHAGEILEVVLLLKVAQGFHVQPHVPGDREAFATVARVRGDLPLASQEWHYPEGEPMKGAGTAGAAYHGSITIRGRCLVAAGTKPGTYTLRATVLAQPCSETYCLAPEKVGAELKVEVK